MDSIDIILTLQLQFTDDKDRQEQDKHENLHQEGNLKVKARFIKEGSHQACPHETELPLLHQSKCQESSISTKEGKGHQRLGARLQERNHNVQEPA